MYFMTSPAVTIRSAVGLLLFISPVNAAFHPPRVIAAENIETEKYPPFREYYMVRNILYLTKKYRTDYHKVNARFTYQTIKDVIRGRIQFAPVRCAYRDYLKGTMGKWEM